MAASSHQSPKGHWCQAVVIFIQGLGSVASIPLVARISEGLVFSNRDKRVFGGD